MNKKKLAFTVTNDLSYDQRMIRICSSLAAAGYHVMLIGCSSQASVPLKEMPFTQKRLRCFFRKGKIFYAEYNLRLLFYLLTCRINLICAIDLDTILPCYLISRIKRIQRVYDAHELFCEMKEVVERPAVYRMWKRIEKYTVPQFHHGYTVNDLIAKEFKRMYDVDYEVVRNIPNTYPLHIPAKQERYILYQGAVNEGRCFEMVIPAMQHVDARLIVCGSGNFMEQAMALAKQYGVEDKVQFEGRILPHDLRTFTLKAWIGLTLCERHNLSYYYSLANRWFDYLQAGIPQLCSDYPIYRDLNNQYKIAVLIEDMSPDNIARELNRLLKDQALYDELQQNCLKVRDIYNWQQEEKKLIAFYSTII